MASQALTALIKKKITVIKTVNKTRIPTTTSAACDDGASLCGITSMQEKLVKKGRLLFLCLNTNTYL
jgi:hypothetical protein